ncbi:uncharacterized protein LOC143145075 isoform X2 [Ptiloglossa arizonensis]|uniref:uncharacterized protein LOC143145075 isoform X2 n=1 Tax=Ptiloglossa arizonensis TaxID=3350558 RepID=UPI003F9EDF73
MFMLTGLFWSNLSVLSSLSRGAAYAIHLGRLRHRSESILIHVGDVESHSGCKCGGSFEPNTHPWLPLSVHEIILARLSFSAQIAVGTCQKPKCLDTFVLLVQGTKEI